MLKIYFNRTIYMIALFAVVWILIQNHVIDFKGKSVVLTNSVKTIPVQIVKHDTAIKWHDTTIYRQGKPVPYQVTHDSFITSDKRYQIAVGDSQGCGSDTLHQSVTVKDLKPIAAPQIEPGLKNKVYVGINAGYSGILRQPLFGPSILFQDKKERVWMLQYDILNKTVIGSVAWKVSL